MPDIAAVLIVRDEERCITRCVESVRPWVDRVVVVDTGSTDDSIALAQCAGAEVHRCDWPDDFSVARNHALDLADADWNLVIDADEWIESGGEMLREWCQGPQRLGTICIHSRYDRAGAGADRSPAADRSWITRLLPRGVRYEGRVHEQPVSPLPRKRLDLHVGHDGYLDAQLAYKRDRNRPLLLLELGERPGDPYILFQLGKDAEMRADYPAACDCYGRALAGTRAAANWRHELLVRYLHCLGQAGRVDEALGLAGAEMEAWAHSPDFFFVVGNLALERAMSDPTHALDQWLPLATSAWERCLEIGERPDLEGSVHGRGSHLAKYNLDVLRAQTAAI
ncbi:MAG: glycosyltransferase family 2 protein [Allosphingosinicella sp.]|uniref:glycosyltransferase family 2 protein n=1 Tax=Allosphingosinicella sp. TaxID=2823234 RepID=UPI0039505371